MRGFVSSALATAALVAATLPVGAKAPNFSTRGAVAGKVIKVDLQAALERGPVVLFFFPAAFTGGCNAQANAFSQAITDFRAAGATVIGMSADDVPTLAFDHAEVLDAAMTRLRAKVRYEPIGFELLPPRFTLSQLQRLYETVLDRSLDKRNFRKKILSMGILVETNEIEQDVAHRAARLYRFDEAKYRKMKRKGFNFEV